MKTTKNRYFVVFYMSANNIIGNSSIVTEDGRFPSFKNIIDFIKQGGADKPVITNIFEFKNQKDFLDYVE